MHWSGELQQQPLEHFRRHHFPAVFPVETLLVASNAVIVFGASLLSPLTSFHPPTQPSPLMMHGNFLSFNLNESNQVLMPS
jgi:hypothetical protein